MYTGQCRTGHSTQLQATNERNECNQWRPRVAVMSQFEEAPCHCFVVAACVRRMEEAGILATEAEHRSR